MESTPRMKINNWAMSEMLVLSSTAREYARKSFPIFSSCSFRLMDNWYTRTAMVFLLRLMFKKSWLLSKQTSLQTFSMQFLVKSPFVYGRADFMICQNKTGLDSSLSLRFGFSEQSFRDLKPRFNSFYSLCSMSIFLSLSVCLVS